MRDNDRVFLIGIEQYRVTLGDLGRAWLGKAERFTSVPWSDPAASLTPEQYAQVSLIDLNPPGEKKTKDKIKLPIRSTPGGPINVNGLKAAGAALAGARQEMKAPLEAKRKAARTVVRLMRAADIEVASETLLRLAGQTSKQIEVEIIAKDAKKQIAYGVILRPDVTDADGHRYTAEEVEKAAHRYMARTGGATDWKHQENLDKSTAVLVESVILGTDINEWFGAKCDLRKGDWLGGVYTPDPDRWQKMENGEINAFSISGFGKLEPV